MKKILSIIAIAIAVSLTLEAAPAKKSSKKGNPDLHGVTIWGGGGYSGIVNKTDNSKFIGGGGGLIGVGYEYQHKKFVLNIGPEFRLFSSKDKMTQLDNPYTYDLTNQLWNGSSWQSVDPVTKYYNFENFSERQLVGQLMVPILAGAQFDDWYFMAGVKLGYTLLGNYKHKTDYTTTAHDPLKLGGDYSDMESHNLGTFQHEQKGKNKFGFDATLSAEAGVILDRWMPESWLRPKGEENLPFLHYRLGAFIDYGLKNLSLSDDGAMIWVDADNAYSRSLHQSSYQKGRLNSLLVGVKFTVFFQLNKPKQPKPLSPRMVASVYDRDTKQPVSQAKVLIGFSDQPKKRPATKYTNQKGTFTQRMVAGNYNLQVSKNDYLPQERDVEHIGDATDTICFALVPVPVFHLFVVDARTEKGLEAKAEFLEQGTENVLETRQVAVDKELTVKLKMDKQYTVRVSAPNYVDQTIEIDTIASTIVARMNPIEKGKKYTIENLFFASNETKILPESEDALQQLFEFLNENPDVRIRIIGHTDSVGTDQDNQILSEGRANSVRQSMIDRGIDGGRIEAEGRGEREPVATNETPEGRQQNRRVEFMVL